MCFEYLVRSRDVKVVHKFLPYLYVLYNVTPEVLEHSVLVPNITNPSDVSKICSTVSDVTCERWRECCHAANDCCREQLETPQAPNGSCPKTWDGWGCWEEAEAGTDRYIACPGFLQFVVPSSYAKKSCQANGTWYTRYNKPNNNKSEGSWSEWTDYTTCLDMQRLVTSVYLALSCNACSILFLVPALLIFLVYRSLRHQHRIRLHINFFAALLFANIMSILWDVTVTYDRVTSDSLNTTPVLMANGTGCKILAFFRLYFKSTTYVWMFCEGFYLHRLISNAFRPPKSLSFFYGSGWGVPLFYCVLYVVLRGVYANDSCWANTYGHLEWIIYTPNFLCLMVNLLFLCNILRVLLTQLQSHPNEPSNFRRALKATFVLIPLFGVQLFVTIYRFPTGQPGGAEYEQFTVLFTNSQGFFVALIFCFFNGEILRKVRKRPSRDEMNYYLSVRSHRPDETHVHETQPIATWQRDHVKGHHPGH